MRPGGERPAAPPAAGAGPRARLWSVARGGGGAGQRRIAVLFARASRAPRLGQAVGAPGGIPGGPAPQPVPGAASIPQPDAPEGFLVASQCGAGPAAAAEACRRGTARAPHGFAVSTSLSGFCPFFLLGVLTRELFSTGRSREGRVDEPWSAAAAMDGRAAPAPIPRSPAPAALQPGLRVEDEAWDLGLGDWPEAALGAASAVLTCGAGFGTPIPPLRPCASAPAKAAASRGALGSPGVPEALKSEPWPRVFAPRLSARLW